MKPAVVTPVSSTRNPFRRMLTILFLIALAARLLVFGAVWLHGGESEFVFGDSTRYIALAKGVVAGQGYVYEDGPEAYRPPGYPAYLMPFFAAGAPLWAPLLLQILIAALIPVGVAYAAVAYLQLPHPAAWLAGLFAALEPVQVYYSVLPLADAFFAVAMLLAIFFLLRYGTRGGAGDVVLAGVSLGVANYLRPAGLYASLALALAALVVAYLRRTPLPRTAAHMVLFAVVVALTMLPWSVRNHRVFGSYAFVSSDAYVLYAYGAADAIAVAEKRPYEEVKQELLARLAAEAPDGTERTSLRNRDWLFARSREAIQAHPVAYLEGYLLGANTLFLSGNYHYLLAKYDIVAMPTNLVSFSHVLATQGAVGLLRAVAERVGQPYTLIAIVGKAMWTLLVALSLVGAWRLRRFPLAVFYLALVAYFAATVFAVTIGVEARHRYALNPLIFLFAAPVIYLLYEKALGRRAGLQRGRDGR